MIDDATSRLSYAQLWPGETTRAVMTAMRDVVHQHGTPEAFYTDRAGWAFDTPKAGGKVESRGQGKRDEYDPGRRGASPSGGRAHSLLLAPGSGPIGSALQDRLDNELRVIAQASTLEKANQFLLDRPTTKSSPSPRRILSAFVGLDQTDLDEIFFEEDVRNVGKDSTVGIDGILLQIEKQAARRTCRLAVKVRRHLDGGYSIRRGTQLLGAL